MEQKQINIHKKTGPKRVPLSVCFWSRVFRGEAAECWLWTGRRNAYGYGMLGEGGRGGVLERIVFLIN